MTGLKVIDPKTEKEKMVSELNEMFCIDTVKITDVGFAMHEKGKNSNDFIRIMGKLGDGAASMDETKAALIKQFSADCGRRSFCFFKAEGGFEASSYKVRTLAKLIGADCSQSLTAEERKAVIFAKLTEMSGAIQSRVVKEAIDAVLNSATFKPCKDGATATAPATTPR